MNEYQIVVSVLLLLAVISFSIDVLDRWRGAKLKPMYVDRGRIVDGES